MLDTQVRWLPVEQIAPNPHQPRREFAPGPLAELAESIRRHGIIQPLSGRRVFLLKDVRLFLNSLDRGLRLVREAGIGAESRREDTEDAILLTIRIPKNRRIG